MNYNGLSSKEVEESRSKYGENILPESEPTTFWDEFKETFSDPMIKILLVIAVIMIGMFFLGYAEIYEPIGTMVAVLIVAFVSAKTAVASDTAYRDTKASVKKDEIKTYRDDGLKNVIIDDIVVGDYVVLQSGDKVPADGVLIEGNLKVDNSALNGESEECKKKPCEGFENALFTKEITGDTFVDDSSLFRGAVVTDGEGVMKVYKVGIESMMGKMAAEMNTEEPDSPLRVKLDKLAGQISVFGYVGAVVIALFMMIYNIFSSGGFGSYGALGVEHIVKDLINAVSLAIVIIVCAVPEGLPLMISLVLMQNTKKMLDKNVLVRKAIGIETAGSLNILFSDKTGTITKGKLEVVEYFTGSGEVLEKYQDEFLYAVAKNTQSSFDSDGNIIGGNFTDRALVSYLGQTEFDKVATDGNVIENSQGFNSTNKFSQAQVNGRTYYKGAPERLVVKAKKYLDKDGVVKDLDEKVLNDKIDSLAERAMRVLAFGYSEKPMKENEINDDIILIGLVGIRDEVRDDAKQAIKEITGAGVQLVMITGDRLETAKAIAKDAGLVTSDDDLVFTSAQLNEMSDEDVKKVIPKIRVIARALPTDKSRMVRLSQELNLVCGMTGDGRRLCPVL